MSTQLALTVVGGAIGSYFGYPMLGAELGGMVGGAIDQSNLKGPTVEGPRLSDLRAQTGSQGAAIVRVYGSIRLAGNAILALPIKETRTETQTDVGSGGKGSGPKATNITYSYSQTLAIGLCDGENEIVGIRKIWANGELIYNASDDADEATLRASIAATPGMVVYYGSEDQMPDPTLQAAVGAANCPAYRGLVYVVFQDLPLEKYFNRTPNLEFEVVTRGSTGSFDYYIGRQLTMGVGYWSHLGVPGFRWLPDEVGSYAIADLTYGDDADVFLGADMVVNADFTYTGSIPVISTGWGGGAHSLAFQAAPEETNAYLFDPNHPPPGGWGGSPPYAWNNSSVGTNTFINFYNRNIYGSITTISIETIPLAEIVSDICLRSGLTSDQIDVSRLTDEVNGYAIAHIQTARACLEPLQSAYFFDAVESDGKLKFIPRGQASVADIPEDDLAAHDAGSQMPDNLATVFQQETELPREVLVNYFETESAYASGIQYDRRLVGHAQQILTLNLSMSLSATKAKQIAAVALWNAWMGRNTFQAMVSRKYAQLEPTDVVTVHKGAATHTARIVGKNEAKGIITFDLARENVGTYTQTLPAVSQNAPNQSIVPIPSSDMELLDIPLLRDADDGPGFYVAASPAQDPSYWHGMSLYRSVDAGASWGLFGPAVLSPSAMGTASGALGDFHSGNIFDESNSVTVVLLDGGALSSVSELLVLSGANAALLGDEIIQYKNADLTAAHTYRLSGLLRGRRGTEWAMAGHVSGERFVALSSALVRISDGTADIGLTRSYKGVTSGTLLADAVAESFADTGRCLKPYAPVHLGGGRDASGNLVIQWIRRSRLGGEWRNNVDVPLGEASEAYEVEIWDSAFTTLKRTITGLSSPAASYSATNQTTDSGSPQSSIGVRVYQLSATIGRGYPAQAVI